ncbi:hypothetical protein BDZ89DRAFT_1132177 [Hymenopellis radicata]|nr:hypothetical protein BDZ89DRAFT_1132177 [Hymenopellis radicata]
MSDDNAPAPDPVEEILDSFYYEGVDFGSDGEEWPVIIEDDDEQELLETSSITSSSSAEMHSETDEETTLFYDLYGDSMSESSSIMSDPPNRMKGERETDSIVDVSSPIQSANSLPQHDRDIKNDDSEYSPEREDIASGFGGAPSLSCLEMSTSPRPAKMVSRLSTDTIKSRNREVVLT